MTRRVISSDDEMNLMNNFPDGAGGGIGAGAAPPPAVLADISAELNSEGEGLVRLTDTSRRAGDNMAMANRNVEVSLLERAVLNQNDQLMLSQLTTVINQLTSQHELLTTVINHIMKQDQANNVIFQAMDTLIEGLQRGQTELLHTQREQENQINNNTTRINDVDARVDQLQEEVSGIKTHLERFSFTEIGQSENIFFMQGLQKGQTELHHTQREEGSQINNNGTRINEVDARVDNLQEELSAIKTYLERFSFTE